MKRRIIINWKTTAVGILIVTLSVLAVVYKYATWSEVVGFITTAGVMTWTRDTFFTVNPTDSNNKTEGKK